MTTHLTFGGSTACLGHDGWFQLGRATIDTVFGDGECIMSLYATAGAAPLRVMLHVYNPEDLRTLIGGLAKALAQMTTSREETDHA